MNSTTPNPFLRGHVRVSDGQLLMIQHNEHYPPCVRRLHPSQQTLPTDRTLPVPCVFNEQQALVYDNPAELTLIDGELASDGQVIALMRELLVHDGQDWTHLCTVPATADPHDITEALSFETGHYSRSWEISSTHAPAEDLLGFQMGAGRCFNLFESFVLPSNDSAGFKLYSTPWTPGDHAPDLGVCQDHAAHCLYMEDIPAALANLLLLAGEADVRVLILDPDAAVLPGLQTYHED